ncbi:hypothetical protein J5N97_025972 [Dioscorea zingiberensis]|uniref:TF-B3 domain-containing protein n=1 Tax=Dioscorea zingiberensis TaxID=325984 RepID=A0A9D5H630_9LILI|nr:hypothetical protein J5N97_025972 [Dioscorea zingiberensis]
MAVPSVVDVGLGEICIEEGWETFHVDHDVEAGDLLVITYAGGVRFEVEIFGSDSCRREVGPNLRPRALPRFPSDVEDSDGMASDASASSSSSSSHESAPSLSLLIPSPSKPIASVAIPDESRDVSVQGLRVHPASRAMGRGSGTFISLLGQKDIDSLVEKYEIDLSLFEVRVPCSEERASSPREGEIAIYQDALLGGLRIPFSNFAKAVREEYNLCPSQLTPNSLRLLNGFVIVFRNYGVNPTVRWFRMLFSLCL